MSALTLEDLVFERGLDDQEFWEDFNNFLEEGERDRAVGYLMEEGGLSEEEAEFVYNEVESGAAEGYDF